jgi:hypothetical protein
MSSSCDLMTSGQTCEWMDGHTHTHVLFASTVKTVKAIGLCGAGTKEGGRNGYLLTKQCIKMVQNYHVGFKFSEQWL